MALVRKTVGVLLLVWVASQFKINPAIAQVLGTNIESYRQLEFVDRIPKYLLTTKSAVFISYPNVPSNPPVRADWKKFAKEIHRMFKKIGIDAIGYYHMEDVVSGVDPAKVFAAELKQRQLKYLILIEKSETVQQDSLVENYRLIITAFNKKESFMANGQKALKMEYRSLDKLLNELAKEVYRSELKYANFLITDRPEFFTDAPIIKGRRIQTYAMDLKVEKLVVPRFARMDSIRSATADPNKISSIQAYNRRVDAWNVELEIIMESYPLDYELTDLQSNEDIYRMGYQYALFRLHTTGKTIREMLNYPIDQSETDYISIKANNGGSMIKSIPVDAPVYKYYVKHVYTKDVYTGLKWDADLTWQEALRNFIFNMKDVLKLKNQ